jgi:hypothetical protein
LSFVRAVPVALVLALAVPGVAQASATLSVTGSAPHKTLTFTVDDALDHSTTAASDTGDLVIWDNVGIAVGASGCIVIDANRANCGQATEFELVTFMFAGGDDEFTAFPGFDGAGFPIDVSAVGGEGDDVLGGGTLDDTLNGGPGNDLLVGNAGDDDIFGEDGNDVIRGGSGVDLLDGGNGDDYLSANETPPEADYEVSCGVGKDVVVDYSDADPIADDCETVDPPYFDGELRITGEPRVWNELSLSLPTNIGGDGVATIQWELCTASGNDCSPIFGEDGPTFTPIPADQGARVRARYTVYNALGEDSVESEATDIVAAAEGAPPTPHPPHPHPTPRPPRPVVAVATPVLGPFLVARAPSFTVHSGRATVDTGRSIRCRGSARVAACHLSVTARPSGASARLRGRPGIAGTTNVAVAGGAEKKVMVSLNRTAYRLLRAHRKLTLSVTAVLTRPGYGPARASFTVTVRAPAHRR